MSKAYKCDRCQTNIVGDAEMQVKTNRMIVAINYVPEPSANGNWYLHDYCPGCAEIITSTLKRDNLKLQMLLAKE